MRVDAQVTTGERAIRRQAGWRPFWRLWRKGRIPPGEARITDGGRGPARYLIHLGGLTGQIPPELVHLATDSAIKAAFSLGCHTVAFPLIGAASGGLAPEKVTEIMWPLLDQAKPAFAELVVVVNDLETLARVRAVWPGALE